MSRQVRYRVTALVLGGLLVGAPLLTNGTASAGQVEDGGRQVTFSGGGVLGLSCRAKPDVDAMTVPANAMVRMVNHTGHSAKLVLNGSAKGSIADGGSAQVVFRRGTTAVLLDPNCALGDQATPVLVTAAPTTDPSASMPDPIPAPSDSSGEPAPPSAPGTPSGGAALPDTTSAERPGASGQGPARPGTARPAAAAAAAAATTAAEGMPQGGAASRFRTKDPRGTGTTAPAFAGMPPGDRRAVLAGVPGVDLPPTTDPAQIAAAVPAAVAEPVAAMQPLPSNGPIGLLALTAAVCVIGVALGAIRTIAAQRASRSRVA